jgi:hypothetical protein
MPKVITKHSSTASAVPIAADLEVGELAVNTFDGKLFTKHTDNSIKDLTPSGGSVTSGSGTVTLDFGSGSNEASVVVGSQTEILSTAKVNLGVNADSTSGNHTASDHKWFLQFCSLTASTPVNATGFTIYARSVHKLVGTWVVQYNWIN